MTFQVPYAYGLLILIIGVAFAVTFFAYRRNSFDGVYRFLLPTLRWLGLVFLGVLLLKPLIVDHSITEERPLIIWLQDESESILSHADSSLYLNNYPDWLEASIEGISGKFDVVTYGFDAEVHPFVGEFKGAQSAQGQALEEATIRSEGRNVAGIVLATDGIANSGIPLSVNTSSLIPVYSLGLGDSTHYPDMRVVKVRNNPIAFVGNSTPIVIDLESEGLSTDRAKVELYRNKVLMESQWATFNRSMARVRFEVTGDSAGMESFEVRVPVLNQERNAQNNQAFTRIEFVDNRRTIDIVYKAPHPDIAALRLPLKDDPSYEVRLISHSDWTLEDSRSSDLVLFHLCNPSREEYAKLETLQKSVVQVTSESSSYRNVAALSSAWNGISVADRVSDVSGRLQSSFSSFQIDEDWSSALSSFPPLRSEVHSESGNGLWKTALLANVGRVETQTPLLSVIEQGNQRLGWMNGEGWWRWRAYSYVEFGSHEMFDGVIRQWYRWLLTRPGADRLIVEHPLRINAGEDVTIVARPRDAAMQPFEGASVTLQLTELNGNQTDRQFEETLPGVYKSELSDLMEGTYSYRVIAKLGSEELVQRGQFMVQNIRLEQQDMRARFDLLSAISSSSGGLMFTYDSKDDLVSTLMELEAPSILHDSVRTESLLKKWWPWVIIVLLFATEWALRKREGQV